MFVFCSPISASAFILDTGNGLGVSGEEKANMRHVDIDFESKRDGRPFLRADLQDDGNILLYRLDPKNPEPVPDVIEPWMLCWA